MTIESGIKKTGCPLLLTLIALSAVTQDNVLVVPDEIVEAGAEDIYIQTYGGDSLDRALFILRAPSGILRVASLSYESGFGSPLLLEVNDQLELRRQYRFPDSSFAFWFAGTVAHDGSSIFSGFRRAEDRGLDCYLTKVGNDGEVIWDKTFGGPQHDQGYKITRTRDSCYVIAAQTMSWGKGNIDGLVYKVDEQGKRQWHKTLGDSLLNRLYSVIEIADGDLIISGITNANYPADSDILIYRLDREGNPKWQKRIGSPHGDIAHSLTKLSDSTFLVVGYTAEKRDSLSDPLILHMNDKGDVLNKLIVPTSDDTKLINGFVDDDGNYVGTGFVRNDLQSDWDILLFKYDLHSKETVARKVRITDMDEEAYHCIWMKSGYALIAGHTMGKGNGDIVLLQWKYK